MKNLLLLKLSKHKILLLGIAAVLVLAGVRYTHRWDTPGSPPVSSSKTTQSLQPDNMISPLIFGTNLLLDEQDQKLSSPMLQAMLEQMHIRVVRFPATTLSVPEAQIIRVAKVVNQVGAEPLVVLPGAGTKDGQAKDTTIVKDMNQVFGKMAVYYEYGNEDNILGTSASQYAAAWNAEIPGLKQLALNGKFIGPVTYQYDQQYVATFLHNARPHPDAISWHEYTCAASETESACLTHIGNWNEHISSALSTIQKALNMALPIMITEWNYAPNATAQDQKVSNAAFMKTWTTQAIQTMAHNQIYASMQYALTGTSTSLIATNEHLTIQGTTFQQLYNSMILANQKEAAVNSTPASTTTTNVSASTTTEAMPTTSISSTGEVTPGSDMGAMAGSASASGSDTRITPTTPPIPIRLPTSVSLPASGSTPLVASQLNCTFNGSPAPGNTSNNFFAIYSTSAGWLCYAGLGTLSVSVTNVDKLCTGMYTGVIKYVKDANNYAALNGSLIHTCYSVVQLLGTTIAINQVTLGVGQTLIAPVPIGTLALHNCMDNTTYSPGDTENSNIALLGDRGWQCFYGAGTNSISVQGVTKFCTGNNLVTLVAYNQGEASIQAYGSTKFACYTIPGQTGAYSMTVDYITEG